MVSSSGSWQVPMSIGPYEVRGELARGGMGVVLDAWDSRLQAPVVIKLLLAGREATAAQRKRFSREARALLELDHPHVVRVRDLGEFQGVPYLVLERVDGESLEARVRRGPLPLAEACAIGRALALALAALHERGLVHRDVKPENVLLDAVGRPKLADLGLVKDLSRVDQTEALTRSGSLLGSPGYWSPEQASGGAAGPASDVYSLAASLYAALTGELLFPATSMVEAAIAAREQPPPPLRRARPEASPALEALLLECLAKDPAARPSAAAVASRLGGGQAPGPGAARRPRRALALALAALGLGTLGTAGWAALRAPAPAAEAERSEPTPRPGPARPAPAASPQGYAAALARARRLAGFRYLDTTRYAQAGNSHEIARFTHERTGLTFCLIPGGRCRVGSAPEEPERNTAGWEDPAHEVTVEPFLLCQTELTQAAWQAALGPHRSGFRGPRRPVDTVSWEEARAGCAQLDLRLPTEAEWEYACRAGSTTPFSWGETTGPERLRCSSPSGMLLGREEPGQAGTVDVASYPPNAFGLYDMHGNVWEWVEDAWHESYRGAPADGRAWEEPSAERKVIRGGAYMDFPGMCRSASRNANLPASRGRNLGLRPARSLPPAE